MLQCAGNDGHNVDTMDALVNLVPVILAAYLSNSAADTLRSNISEQVSMCRRYVSFNVNFQPTN